MRQAQAISLRQGRNLLRREISNAANKAFGGSAHPATAEEAAAAVARIIAEGIIVPRLVTLIKDAYPVIEHADLI